MSKLTVTKKLIIDAMQFVIEQTKAQMRLINDKEKAKKASDI